MTGTPDNIEWISLFKQWERRFQAVAPLPATHDFSSFQKSVENMTVRYSGTTVSKCIASITPTFDHIKSFTNALNALTQIADGATLTWGVLQIVMEVRCRISLPYICNVDWGTVCLQAR